MAATSSSSSPNPNPNTSSKRRGSYNCGRCGQPKKGHVCSLPSSSSSSPTPSLPPPPLPRSSSLRRSLTFDEPPVLETDLVVVENEEEEEEDLVAVGRGRRIPASLLMEVLRRVEMRGMVEAGRVSKGWRECVKRMMRGAEEIRVRVSAESPIGFVGMMMRNCAGLVKIKLTMESDATLSTLTCLAFYCSKLESLEINMANGATNRIPGDGLSRFIAEKKHLSVLKMEGCKNLGYLNISSTSLSTLWLSDLRSISKAVFNCPNMKELSLSFEKENDSTDLPALMDNLGRTCNKLRNLHVYSNQLSNEAVLALASANLRCLKWLSLINGSTITDAAVASIIESYSNLELLDLSGSSITDSGIGMISKSYSTTLSRLLLSNCPNITSSGIQLAAAQLPYLTLLDCGMSLAVPTSSENRETKSWFSEETGKPNPRNSSCQKLFIEHANLKILSLWGCSALDGLYVNCPELTDLNLNICTNLHPERLLLQCPNLERIYSFACQDMVIGAIRNQVLNEFAAAKADFCRKRLADGSKRVLVPHSLSFFENEEEKCSKRPRQAQCSVIL